MINIKHRIIELLDKNIIEEGLDINLSVKEVMDKFKHDIKEYDKETQEKDLKTLNEFKNVYLKKYSNSDVFGKKLEVYHIKSIEFECYNTEHEKMYKIDGTRIIFNGFNTNTGEFTNRAHDLMLIKNLRECKVITKEEYDNYMENHRSLKKQFNEIVTE